jgi:DNA-binding NarL/FixJ family response regulator
MKSVKILIADDHKIVRQGISSLLESMEGFEIICEASNGLETVKLTKELNPDLIVMDINMPLMDGVDACYEIRKFNKKIKILILTMMEDEQYIFDALSAGINGYLFKLSGIDELSAAVKTISEGENYFDFRVTNILLNKRKRLSEDTALLSKRESEILRLIVKGFTSKQIGLQLFISQFTAQKHRKNIIRKLKVSGTAELVKYAIQHGLVENN